MNCPGCNAPLKPGAGKCLECGYTVSAAPPGDRKPADWAKLMLGIVKLEETAILEVARDPNATMIAIAAVAAGGAAPAIGSFAIFWLVLGPIWMLISSGISIALINFVAKQLGGKGELVELYRVQGMTYGLHLVGIVPLLGPPLVGLVLFAQILLLVNNVKVVHKMPLPAAIATVVVPYVIFTIVMGVAVTMLGVTFLALFSRAH